MENSTSQPLYSKLKGPSEIRLLSLLPGTEDDPVRCEIHHVVSPQDALYIALSYTWGDPKDTTTIQLNSRKHQVTRNLASFLRHIQVIAHIVVDWIRNHMSADDEDSPQRMLQTVVSNILTHERFTGLLQAPTLESF